MKLKRSLSKFLRFIFVLSLILLGGIMMINTVFPVKHLDIIEKYALEHGLEPAFVFAMIYTESRFREEAVSHKGATGLMQIMPSTADWIAEQLKIENYFYSQMTDPDINIRIGTWYIARLIRQFGEADTALAAYNAGSGKVSSWLMDERYSEDGKILSNIPYKETRDYVERVNLFYKIYSIRLRFT